MRGEVMVKRLAFSVMAVLTLTAAAPEEGFQPTPTEQKRLELHSQPESWFLQNLAGPREVVDSQHLDPKLQQHFEARRRRTPDEVKRGLGLFYNPVRPRHGAREPGPRLGHADQGHRTIEGRSGPTPILNLHAQDR